MARRPSGAGGEKYCPGLESRDQSENFRRQKGWRLYIYRVFV